MVGVDVIELGCGTGHVSAWLARRGALPAEIRPPDGSSTGSPYVTLEWVQRWPCGEAWKAAKLG